MANQLYPKGKEAFLGADMALDTDNIKASLTNTTYSAVHQFLSDVVISDASYTSPNLVTKVITNGIFNSDNLIMASAVAGAAQNFLVLYQDSGVAATSRLIAHIDTATGLPVTPDGTNINITVDPQGWFSL